MSSEERELVLEQSEPEPVESLRELAKNLAESLYAANMETAYGYMRSDDIEEYRKQCQSELDETLRLIDRLSPQ